MLRIPRARFFLLGDEGDENNFGVPTRTLVFDVSDLDAPQLIFAYEATTTTIDHNLYVLGNRVFQANYASGLRVLEFAYLVTYPDNRAGGFPGAWSVYPYLPSGTIVVSDGTNGLFVLSIQ